MVSLVDMPGVVMTIILKKLEYVEIQCLRKTCRSLRRFIDDTHPEQSINVLEISGSAGQLSLSIHGNDDPQLYPNGQKIYIRYQSLESEITEVTWSRTDKNRQKTILNENFSEVLSRDLGLILECNLPTLRRFSMDFKNTCTQFLEKYLSNKNPVKTNILTLRNAQSQEDVLSFLRYIYADTLKKWEIQFLHYIDAKDISKIMKLEHSKKSKNLHIYGSPVTAGIQNFEHFSFLIVKFEVLYLNDVLFLKELFLQTPSTFKQFRINFQQRSNRDAFIQEFGPPIDRTQTLILERPDDKNIVVTIEHFEKFFEFKIVKKCDVPKDAEVVN